MNKYNPLESVLQLTSMTSCISPCVLIRLLIRMCVCDGIKTLKYSVHCMSVWDTLCWDLKIFGGKTAALVSLSQWELVLKQWETILTASYSCFTWGDYRGNTCGAVCWIEFSFCTKWSCILYNLIPTWPISAKIMQSMVALLRCALLFSHLTLSPLHAVI